jgi:hypothetical protein
VHSCTKIDFAMQFSMRKGGWLVIINPQKRECMPELPSRLVCRSACQSPLVCGPTLPSEKGVQLSFPLLDLASAKPSATDFSNNNIGLESNCNFPHHWGNNTLFSSDFDGHARLSEAGDNFRDYPAEPTKAPMLRLTTNCHYRWPLCIQISGCFF